ncbi:MAG: alpha/beta fold hydrolase [Pseudomonadota bacterium]|nr:MAG: alpha/beta hydrolase [Pseudomonadota bacterium]
MSRQVPQVVFSHGRDGAPWGPKIRALAQVARRQGFAVHSVDYRGMADPLERVTRLQDVCRGLATPLVLVGSSLGGHVCTSVSRQVPVCGLFLLAPAFFMPGFEQYTPEPADCPIVIVHGWNDAVVPVDNSIRYARQYRAALHILDGDHSLMEQIEVICELFEGFLRRIGGNETCSDA